MNDGHHNGNNEHVQHTNHHAPHQTPAPNHTPAPVHHAAPTHAPASVPAAASTESSVSSTSTTHAPVTPKPKPINTSTAAKQDTKGITAKKADDMAEWYGQVVIKAELADYAPIRGFMVVKPAGYSIWQRIQDDLNTKIYKLGVRNAYFPLLIPESFFHKEAQHAEGFSPEVAWVERQAGEQERYAIRPTSETIMYDSYSRWIRSWRDLPLRMNQWCSVVRWEVQDTKIFLRTREFLWQEGHCVYETEKECQKEGLKYHEFYRQVMEDLLAIPVVLGRKTEKETFAGAYRSYTLEGFMPDGKALQMGTSHLLGQGFAKAFGISFLGKDGTTQTPWQNSWGLTTRLIGALVMTHSDDKGLVLPPRVAENKVVVVPILFDNTKAQTIAKARELGRLLKRFNAIVDDREEYSAGWKFNYHELHGVPLRIEIGPKDMEKNQCVISRRDTGEKTFVPLPELQNEVRRLLDAMQQSLFEKAQQRTQSSIIVVKDWAAFEQADRDKKLIFAAHCGVVSCEQDIKDVTKGVTARCIPLRGEKPESGALCIRCGKKAKYLAYFARAY